MLKKVKTLVRRFHRDEQGADMVEYVLIMAAIALPILAVVIWFREEIKDWLDESWSSVRAGEGTAPSD